MVNKRILFIAILVLYARTVFAVACGTCADTGWDACTAADGNVATLRVCISHANSGAVISIPTGTSTWNTTDCNDTGVCLSINKPLSIIGAGVANTIIIDNTIGNASINPIYITYSSSAVGMVNRISGIHFEDGLSSRNDGMNALINSIITDTGGSPTTIIDNITFDGHRRPIRAYSRYGLVHNCTINDEDLIIDRGDPYGAWSETTTFGVAMAWYFEDNIWNMTKYVDGPIDEQDGGRYVSRCNQLNYSSNATGQGFFNHGYDSVATSGMLIESYGNNFTATGVSPYFAILWRGGTGVAHHNTLTGNWPPYIGLTNYRSCTDYNLFNGYCVGGTRDGMACAGSLCANQGGTCYMQNCDGTNPADGNTGGQYGYPCRGQIGRGGSQSLLPIYQWGNTINGSNMTFTVYDWSTPQNCRTSQHVQLNRDYYNSAMPAYTPYTYPHPLRGLSATNTCLTDSNSIAKTGINFQSGVAGPYTVTPSVAANGSISPNAAFQVNSGNYATLLLTPSHAYLCLSGGGTCGGNISTCTFTTNTIGSDCTVIGNFTYDFTFKTVLGNTTDNMVTLGSGNKITLIP